MKLFKLFRQRDTSTVRTPMRPVIFQQQGWTTRFFHERQVFYRSHGQIRYITLSPRQQISGLVILSLLLTWSVISLAQICWRTYVSDAKISEARSKAEQYQISLLQARESETQAKYDAQQQSERFIEEASTITRRLALLEGLVLRVADHQSSLSASHFQDLKSLLTPSEEVQNEDNISTSSPSSDPSAHLAMIVDQQEKVLVLAEQATEKKIQKTYETFDMIGVNIRDAVPLGSGGPFIDLKAGLEKKQTKEETKRSFSQRVETLKERLEHGDVFDSVMQSVPLMSPLKGKYRITSRYGARRDPFTGKPAFHAGMDFGKTLHKDILASAPGKIVFAGWKSGYGKMIDIDHGHGFKTRYGHLSRILVRVGEKVTPSQKIGVMGSTGRSSGPHLHYEVWFKGRSYNPAKFVKAGEYVQGKGKQG